MKFGLEAKVGIFVIVVFIILGYMTTKVSDFAFYKSSGYVVTYQIPSASGLTKDASVKFRGVDVGKVEEINLSNGNVNVKLRIEPEYKIPDNVELVVRSSGFLGEKYAELQATNKSSEGYLADGEVLKGYQSGTDIDQLTSKLGDIAGDVKAITSALREVLATTEGKNNMKATLDNIRVTTEMMKDLLKNNQQRVNNIVASVEKLSSTMERMAISNEKSINNLVKNLEVFSSDLRTQTPVIAEKINRIADRVNNITGDVDEVMSSSKQDLKDTIKSMHYVTSKLEKTVDNVNEITGKINKGGGTLGTLVNDNKTADDIKETIGGLKNMVTQYDKFQLNLEFAGEKMVDTGETKGYFKLKIDPSDEKYYLLGLATSQQGSTTTTVTSHSFDDPPNNVGHDYTETKMSRKKNSLTFIAQYAHQMFYDNLFLRLGLMESEFGIGADYSFFNDNVTLYVDAYDFNSDSSRNAHLKTKLRYRLGHNLFVDAGYDDFLNEQTRSFFVGGGIRFTDNDLKYLLGKVPFPTN